MLLLVWLLRVLAVVLAVGCVRFGRGWRRSGIGEGGVGGGPIGGGRSSSSCIMAAVAVDMAWTP